MQADEEDMGAMLPGGHCPHAEELSPEENRHGGQLVQVVWPTSDANVPVAAAAAVGQR